MIRRLFLGAAVVALGAAIIVSPASTPKAHAAPAAKAARASLGRSLPEIKFDGRSLEECIDFIRDITDANIVVNWKALEGAGVTKDTLVNLKLRNVTLKKALTLILSEAAAGNGVTYDVSDGVIEITTTELANQKMYTRVYPVGDLLMEIPNFDNAPNFSLDQNQASGKGGGGGTGGGGGGGGGGGLFGGGNGGNQGNEKDKGPTKEERAEELLGLIREVIYPDIWRENGGTASIRMFRDNLVVTAPRKVHEAIGGTWD
jgi:uncharacterized membrane protein YgcG